MKVLVTGAKGFVGKNLVLNLKNIKEEKNRTRDLKIEEIFEYDIDTDPALLDVYCKEADFVFHLAGVRTSSDEQKMKKGNVDFSISLMDALKKNENKCPIVFASSISATLIGRYTDSMYGKSKHEVEEMLFEYGYETGAKVMVYRFPAIFGKWCKPEKGNVIAELCYNVANDLPVKIEEKNTELEMVYIDDLVKEMLDAMEGKEHHCEYFDLNTVGLEEGRYCHVPRIHKATLEQIMELLEAYKRQPENLILPNIPSDSLDKKLYTTYLSYLPEKKIRIPLDMKLEDIGSFTTLFKSEQSGQISLNISKPGTTKGDHWHNSQWEFFIVVSGHGLVRERKIGSDEVLEYEVSGKKIEAIHMLPGYTHSLTNLSHTEDLVTVVWTNENFGTVRQDTYHEEVKKESL